MRERASGSSFYRPNDPSSDVVFSHRCDFLKIVLDNERELSSKLRQKTPLISDALPGYGGDIMTYQTPALIARIFYVDGLDEAKEPFVKIATRRGLISREAVLALFGAAAELRSTTCLRVLPDWALSILLQFAAYCGHRGLDPADHSLISRLTPPGAYSLTSSDELPSFRFSLLEVNEYTRRMASIDEARHLTLSQAPWWFDEQNEEYISYRLPITEQDPATISKYAKQAFNGCLLHYLKRCENEAAAKGLEKFGGKRARTGDSLSNFRWLYWRLVKGWDNETIANQHSKEMGEAAIDQHNKAVSAAAVSKGIQEATKLLGMDST